MKRFLAILGLLVIVASLPAAATAGRATRFSDLTIGSATATRGTPSAA